MEHFETFRQRGRQHTSKPAFIITLLVLMAMLLSACNGDPQAQQRASSQKTKLDSMFAQAREMGIPDTSLQSIVKQEQQISSTSAPFSLFDNQPATDYYTVMAQDYEILIAQVAHVEKQVALQFDSQAYRDIQHFEDALAKLQSQNIVDTSMFENQLAQDQAWLAKARTPKEYVQISSSAKSSMEALHWLEVAYSKLESLRHVTEQLQLSHIDVTALAQQEQDDLALLNRASKPDDFTWLMAQIGVQFQEATAFSLQAIPYVGAYEGAIKLQEFRTAIQEARSYKQDVTTFEQHFNTY